MQVLVVGLGFVGLAHVAAFARAGHQVIGLDVDEHLVAQLNQGRLASPVAAEPGVAAALEAGNCRFVTALTGEKFDYVVLALPTPGSASGKLETTSITETFAWLLPYFADSNTFVELKSTLAPDQATTLVAAAAAAGVKLFYAPEFLVEGQALAGVIQPDRVVLGVPEQLAAAPVQAAFFAVRALAATTHTVVTDPASAALAKLAANTMLAAKISAANRLAQAAKLVGGNPAQVLEIIGLDPRIGPAHFQPGVGYGGSCLPKDVPALAATMEQVGLTSFSTEISLMHADGTRHLKDLAAEIMQRLQQLGGKKLLVIGLAFKPQVQDTRNSAALGLVNQLAVLLPAEVELCVYDPQVLPGQVQLPERVQHAVQLDYAYDLVVYTAPGWQKVLPPAPQQVTTMLAGW